MTNPITAIEKATDDIEQALAQCNVQTLAEMPALRRAVVVATTVTQIRAALTDDVMKRVFMPLQGSALGFVTDKDKDGGYPLQTVRDVLIEGLIMGLQPTNNELNIISNRAYAAKNGLARKLREYPGLTDLIITPGVPHMAGDRGALVPIRASWRIDGKAHELVRDVAKDAAGTVRDTRIPVRVNAGMGPDAIIGKATRKAMKAILDILTGSTLTIDDGEVLDTVGAVVSDEPTPAPATPEQDGKRIALKGKRNGGTPTDETPERVPGQEG